MSASSIQRASPRLTIGTVNAVEFTLTVAISATFLASLGTEFLSVALLGLLAGGVVAAPLGAILAKRISTKPLLILVGCVLTITSLFSVTRLYLW